MTDVCNLKSINTKLLTKYQNTPFHYNNIITNNLIKSRTCKLSTLIKEYLIFDQHDEYLKRYYSHKESNQRIPKFLNYYKNYLKFFCKPTFRHSILNDIIQHHGEKCAEIYYNNNYGSKTKNSKTEKKQKPITSNEKIFSDTIKGNINNISNSHYISTFQTPIKIKKTNSFYNNNNSKETIKFGEDDYKTIITKSIIKDNSLLSILNDFNNKTKGINVNKNKTQNVFNTYSDNKKKLNVSSQHSFVVKGMNTTIKQKPHKINLKLMSQKCFGQKHLRINTNENVYNSYNNKYPILHTRAKTENQKIYFNTKPHKIRVINEIEYMNQKEKGKKNNFQLNKEMFTSSRNPFQQYKPGLSSFNYFDQQQQLLNKKKNKNDLPFVNSVSRNGNNTSDSGNLFRTTMIMNNKKKYNNYSLNSNMFSHKHSEIKTSNYKVNINKGRNMKLSKYSLNIKLKV